MISLKVEYEPAGVPGANAKDLAFLKQQIARACSRRGRLSSGRGSGPSPARVYTFRWGVNRC